MEIKFRELVFLILSLSLCVVQGQDQYLMKDGYCKDFSLIPNPSQPSQCQFLCDRFKSVYNGGNDCIPSLALMKEIIDSVLHPSLSNASSTLEANAKTMFSGNFLTKSCYLNMYQDWQNRDYACSDLTNAAQAKESALRRFIIQFLPNKYHASETSADFYCITTMFRIRNLMDNQLFPSSSCTQNGKSLTPLTYDFSTSCPSACWTATLKNLLSATENKGYCCASLYYQEIIKFL
mmetsp:Transcript_40411/g.127200  ORF Transcript_40411/g.127200 Transcript_40411/m.127200 type:complete len:235 (-) Transcript_40411:742-1446(-)